MLFLQRDSIVKLCHVIFFAWIAVTVFAVILPLPIAQPIAGVDSWVFNHE